MRFSVMLLLRRCLGCKQTIALQPSTHCKLLGDAHNLEHIAVVELIHSGLVTVLHGAFKLRNWVTRPLWVGVI